MKIGISFSKQIHRNTNLFTSPLHSSIFLSLHLTFFPYPSLSLFLFLSFSPSNFLPYPPPPLSLSLTLFLLASLIVSHYLISLSVSYCNPAVLDIVSNDASFVQGTSTVTLVLSDRSREQVQFHVTYSIYAPFRQKINLKCLCLTTYFVRFFSFHC